MGTKVANNIQNGPNIEQILSIIRITTTLKNSEKYLRGIDGNIETTITIKETWFTSVPFEIFA